MFSSVSFGNPLKRVIAISGVAIGLLIHSQASADSKPEITSIAFGSCLHQDKSYSILHRIADKSPDITLLIGDNVYADTTNPRKMQATYDHLKGSRAFQRLKRSTDFLAGTWDDHDYGINDGGLENPIREEAKEIFWNFFDVDYDDDLRNRPGVYSSKLIEAGGQKLQIILLDTRYNRTALKTQQGGGKTPEFVGNMDPKATILGAEQWSWLENQLQIPADIRIIASSIQILNKSHRFEKWANFPLETKKLMNLLKVSKEKQVLILSGDRHFHELSVDENTLDYPLFEFTSSGLNQALQIAGRESNPLRIHSFNRDAFGMIKIDWQQKLITLELIDSKGQDRIWRVISFASESN